MAKLKSAKEVYENQTNNIDAYIDHILDDIASSIKDVTELSLTMKNSIEYEFPETVKNIYDIKESGLIGYVYEKVVEALLAHGYNVTSVVYSNGELSYIRISWEDAKGINGEASTETVKWVK